MVRRVGPPKTVERFQDLVGFGLSRGEEIRRIKELVESGEYSRVELSPLYMMSRHWRYMRKCALRRDEFSCQECGASGVMLHVHHKKYADYGEEKLEDLQTLCVDCHNEKSSFDVSKKENNPVGEVGTRQLFEVMAQPNDQEKWGWY